ncbi:MAG: DinB family protein [Caldilineales bacterium]|nr:DinB family protein [Caldilineales bacterium]
MNADKEAIRQRMQEARALLLDAAAHIDDATAGASTENPHWRVRDILAHVAGSEMGLVRTAERFLAGGELTPGFDLDLWNQRQIEKRQEREIAELLAELEASRAAAWRLLDALDAAQLAVTGRHPAGFRTSVAGIFYTIANHELDHGNELRAALGLPITRQADWQEAAL